MPNGSPQARRGQRFSDNEIEDVIRGAADLEEKREPVGKHALWNARQIVTRSLHEIAVERDVGLRHGPLEGFLEAAVEKVEGDLFDEPMFLFRRLLAFAEALFERPRQGLRARGDLDDVRVLAIEVLAPDRAHVFERIAERGALMLFTFRKKRVAARERGEPLDHDALFRRHQHCSRIVQDWSAIELQRAGASSALLLDTDVWRDLAVGTRDALGERRTREVRNQIPPLPTESTSRVHLSRTLCRI